MSLIPPPMWPPAPNPVPELPPGWGGSVTPGFSGNKIDPYVLIVKGDMKQPEKFIPLRLEYGSYGNPSVLQLQVNCRHDELSSYLTPGDKVELWYRFTDSGSEERCIFRGRMVTENPDLIVGNNDSTSITCFDVCYELNSTPVFWAAPQGVTAAVLLRGLFEGYKEWLYPPGSFVQILPVQIDETLCRLGDDLEPLDKRFIYVSFSGEYLCDAIASIFNALGGAYIWWFEPDQEGEGSVLRFVKRGDGESRFIGIGNGTVETVIPNVSDLRGTIDYSNIRNDLLGLGAPKRYQVEMVGDSEVETVLLTPQWDSSLTLSVANDPTLATIYPDSQYGNVGRVYRVPNDDDTLKTRRPLLRRLQGVLNESIETSVSDFTDSTFKLWYRVTGSTTQFRVYQGGWRMQWEHDLSSDKGLAGGSWISNRTRRYNLRADALTLPMNLFVILDAPEFDYDFALSYSYEEHSRYSSRYEGRLTARTGKQGNFQINRVGLLRDDSFCYEHIRERGYGEDGFYRNYLTIHDDSARLREVLDDIIEVSAYPVYSIGITIPYLDFSWRPGNQISEISNSNLIQNTTLTVENISLDFTDKNMKTQLLLSNRIRIIPI